MRERDREAEARDAESGLGEPMYCFKCRATETHRSARVWMHLGEDQLKEVNVIPVDDRRLERSQWEAVLDAFVVEVLQPSLEGTGLHLERRYPNDLDTYLTEGPRKRLGLFSKLANKGSSNPMDGERWREFVIAAHREDSDLPVQVLEEWLQQRDGQTTGPLTWSSNMSRSGHSWHSMIGRSRRRRSLRPFETASA